MIVAHPSVARREGGDRIRLTARCDVSMKKLVLVLLAVVGVSAQQAPQSGVPSARTERAGVPQIRPRPAQGREPQLQPPTIREYKPKSTLVAPQHPVPRAKFPVIDIHSHQSTPIS